MKESVGHTPEEWKWHMEGQIYITMMLIFETLQKIQRI